MNPVLKEAAEGGVKIIAVLGGYSDDDRKAVEPKWKSNFLKSLGNDRLAVMFVKNTIVHSKILLVDDEFLSIGSANFEDRSLIEAEDEGGGVDGGLRAFLKEVKQAWCTDSEVTVATVDDRQSDLNSALRLRVLLWAEHLRVNPFDQAIWRELSNLSTALSVFDKSWGRTVSFGSPKSRLLLVEILPEN